MSEDNLNSLKLKKITKSTLPFTTLNHAQKRRWKLKESTDLKKETMYLEKVLHNEIKYEKYNIYLCTYHPKAYLNEKGNDVLSKPNLSEFNTLQNSNYNRVKTLPHFKSIKFDETVLVQDLEKWQKEKKIPSELYDAKAIMRRNKLYQKIKEDITKEEYSKPNKLTPQIKRDSSLNIKLNILDQRNQIISFKSLSNREISTQTNDSKFFLLNENKKDCVSAHKFKSEEQLINKREDLGNELYKKFLNLNNILNQQRQKLEALEEELEKIKIQIKIKKEEEKKLIDKLSKPDNIQNSPNKTSRTDSRSFKRSSVKESLINIEQETAKLNEIKESILFLKEKIGILRVRRKKIFEKINELKEEEYRLKSDLIEYFYCTLLHPKEFIATGISLIIEKIWNVGEDINLLRMPKYLDSQSIKYLIKSTKNEMRLRDLKKEYDRLISDCKININISPHHSGTVIIHKSSIPLNKLKENIRNEIKKSKSKFELKNSTGDVQSCENSNLISPKINNNKIVAEHRNYIIDLKIKIENLKNNIQNEKNLELNRIVREYLKEIYLAKESSDLDTIIKTIFGETVSQIEIDKIVKCQIDGKRRFHSVRISRKML